MKKSKIALLSLIPLLLLIGGYAFLKASGNDKPNDTAPVSEESENKNTNPSKNEEAVNKHKESLTNDNSQDQSDEEENSLKSVKPIITSYGEYQGNLEVAARVPGIFEDSGKCTLTLKKNSKSVNQTKNASPNVSEMSCGVIKIPKSKLSSGTWEATVSYKSQKAAGTSDAQMIEVN